MPRPKSLHTDFRCPHCHGHWMARAGTVRGRQLYRCGACGRRSQPDAAYRQGSAEQRAMAVAMRQGGMGVRAIARLLEVNPATVSRWTR